MESDLHNWLEKLGLGKYADAFAENDVDFEVLPELTDPDLRELGLSLGHRRKLLAAIKDLNGKTPANTETTNKAIQGQEHGDAERRQLTVMFVDMVGSTELSSRLDPEEMSKTMVAYQNLVAGAVTKFDGHVAKYMGDGVLCYFGWPQAHEDDAGRAVHAGLAIMQAMGGISTPGGDAIAARAGIATGLVVVGDLVGEGAAQEEAVVGDTPNIAARLQAVATSNQVVFSESTRQLLGEAFELKDLGLQKLQGVGAPTRAFMVLGQRRVESRFAAQQSENLGDIVGRDQELALLLDRWQQSTSGEGQMVLLTGQAGIGKSRITRALSDAASMGEHLRISYQCSPYHADSSLYPAMQQLMIAADFGANDSPEVKLDKLQKLLLEGCEDISLAAPLLAGLLGLGEIAEARFGSVDHTPQQRRILILKALRDQLIGLSRKSPVLFILEDAHWIDPTTLELIEMCLESIDAAQVMILVTARPTFKDGFGGHPIVTRLALNRLGRKQATGIVERITEGKQIPPELMREIVARTDGVPLFVEELTKTLLESKVLRETEDAFVLDGQLGDIAIPTSLHDSLMARLDREQGVKEVAQSAACIGREFDFRLIATILSLDESALITALDKLASAELVYRRGAPPDSTYTFKHALVRDAAYESLLKAKRKEVHGRIVRALEKRLAEKTDIEPALLAYHCTAANLSDQAVDYWQLAGEQAVERSANLEAIAHLSQAISILYALTENVERHRREFRLQTILAGPLIATKGYGADETGQAFSRAQELSEYVDDQTSLFPVFYHQWVYSTITSKISQGRERAKRFLSLAAKQSSSGPQVLGHRVLAVSLYYQGELEAARSEFEASLELYDEDEHQELAYRFGQDPKAACLSFLASILQLLGYPDQAAKKSVEAIEYATNFRHSNTLAYSLYFGPMRVSHCRHDVAAVESATNQLLAFALENNMAMWEGYSRVHNGWVLSRRNESEKAVDEARRGLQKLDETRTGLDQTYMMSQMAEVYAVNSQVSDALLVNEKALQMAKKTGERWYQPELLRQRGDLVIAAEGNSGSSDAVNQYQRAIEYAKTQNAKCWELRASTSLAGLWSQTGERQKAEDLLASVFESFDEGFDTPDMLEARAALEELK